MFTAYNNWLLYRGSFHKIYCLTLRGVKLNSRVHHSTDKRVAEMPRGCHHSQYISLHWSYRVIPCTFACYSGTRVMLETEFMFYWISIFFYGNDLWQNVIGVMDQGQKIPAFLALGYRVIRYHTHVHAVQEQELCWKLNSCFIGPLSDLARHVRNEVSALADTRDKLYSV